MDIFWAIAPNAFSVALVIVVLWVLRSIYTTDHHHHHHHRHQH